MNTKKWYQSYTIWFNFALLLVSFLSQVFALFPVDPKYVSFIAVVGNFLLRFKTIMPIE